MGSAPRRPPRYWSGLSVGWFVLALAIFYWGLHYRLQQYESARMNGGAIPVAKMWLGERSHASTTAVVHTERGGPLFPVIVASLGLLLCLGLRVIPTRGFLFRKSRVRLPLWGHGHALFSRPPPSLVCL